MRERTTDRDRQGQGMGIGMGMGIGIGRSTSLEMVEGTITLADQSLTRDSRGRLDKGRG